MTAGAQPRADGPRTGRPARARSLSCPNCGSPVTVHASGSTVTAACPSCGTLLDVADESVRIIAAAQARTRTPAIPIGARGALDGAMWQVIGYQERSSGGGSWQWEEYLLFNPFQGFRFLAQDHGDWTLFKLLRDDFGDAAPQGYKLTAENTARTDYVLGEFYWRVRVGDEVAVREFAAPPEVLTRESNGSEVTWSRGTSLDAADVSRAFGSAVPGRTDGARAGASLRPTWQVAAAAAALLFVLHVLPFGQPRNTAALRQVFTATAKSDLVSPEFDLPGAGGSVVLEASSAGAEYASVRLRLLPVAGGPGYTAAFSVGGGYRTSDAPQQVGFSAVPGGRYKVAVEIDSDAFAASQPQPSFAPLFPSAYPAKPPADGGASVEVAVAVRRHPVSNANFLLVLAALLAWPAAVTAWRWGTRRAAGD